MSVASVSTRDNAPIILTDGKSTSYKGIYLKSYVIGGESSMSNDIVWVTDSKRIGGNDRFDTNKNIIREFYKNSTEFYVSKAYNLVDSLTGSSLAKNKPIVLVDNGSNKSILRKAESISVLGRINENVLNQCKNVVNSVGNIYTGVQSSNYDEATRAVMDWYGESKIYTYEEVQKRGRGLYIEDENFEFNSNKYYMFVCVDEYGTEGDWRICVNKDNAYDTIRVHSDYHYDYIYTKNVAIKLVDYDLRVQGIIPEFIEVIEESDFKYYVDAYDIVKGRKEIVDQYEVNKYSDEN